MQQLVRNPSRFTSSLEIGGKPGAKMTVTTDELVS
jgi:hypothetical protein